MRRPLILAALVAWFGAGMPTLAAQTNPATPKSAAVMDFELINEMRDYETRESQAALISDALRAEFD
jgi:hypothetical protein